MALAIDSSTPAFAAGSNDPWVTASFTPPDNSLLVVVVTGDWFSGTPTLTPTSSGLTFTSEGKFGATSNGVIQIFTAPVGSNGGTSRTVSVATSLSSDVGGAKVYVVTDYYTADPVEAVASNTGAPNGTNNWTPTVLTTTADGCWVLGGAVNWVGGNLASTSTDVFEEFNDADLSVMVARKSAATSPAGAVTLNFDQVAAGTPVWTYGAIAIRPSTYTPPAIHKVADRGSAQNITSQSSTAVDLAAGGSISTGNYLVARVAMDNSGTSGADRTLTVTDTRSNTWTVTAGANRTAGTASDGSTVYIAYAKVANAYSNGDDLTFTYSGAVVAKAIVVEEWTGIDGTTPLAVAATTATGSSTTPSISRTPAAAGQLFYGALGVEGPTGDTITQDADTSDGAWQTMTRLSSASGTAASNQTINGVAKFVSGTSAQTWNPTITSRDWAQVALVFAAAASGITGTAAVTEAADTASASGKLGYSGTSVRTQAANTSTATGTVVNPVTGSSTASQTGQTGSASGKLGYTGTLARTQAAHTSSASATFTVAGIAGSVTFTQEADSAESFGHLDSGGPDVSLLAAYNFDEASGTILDASGNGRDVTFSGSLTRVTGHTNTGLSQSTTAIDSNGPALTGMQTAQYTIMCWIRRSSNSLDGWLMEFKQSSSGDRGLLMISGDIQARFKNVAGSVFTAAVTQPTAATAYHAAATCDGSTVKLFINGTQVASTAFSGGLRTNSTSSSFIDALGSDTWMDDARYYDTALDAATITTLMNTPVTSGPAPVTGTVAATQDGQTSAAAGQLGYTGTSARTQAGHTSAASGTFTGLGISGNAAVTQAPNTASTSGQLGYSGTAARTQGNQSSTASGQLGYSGTVARTQAAQTSNAAGQLGYTGTATPSQAAQTASASGTFTSPGAFSGSAAATQANQTGAATGKLGYSGTATPTQANQASTASGSVVNPITGTAAAQQGNQTANAAGVLRYTGTAAASQAPNFAIVQGVVFVPITGTLAEIQADQTANASGSALGAVVIRPNTGSTSRPGSGITPRPFAGSTERP